MLSARKGEGRQLKTRTLAIGIVLLIVGSLLFLFGRGFIDSGYEGHYDEYEEEQVVDQGEVDFGVLLTIIGVAVLIFGFVILAKGYIVDEARSPANAPPPMLPPMQPPMQPSMQQFRPPYAGMGQSAGPPPPGPVMYCAQCGLQLTAGSQFCLRCGNKQG
jgi:hypothetical protein